MKKALLYCAEYNDQHIPDDDDIVAEYVSFIRLVNQYEIITEESFSMFNNLWLENVVSDDLTDFYLFITSKYGLALQYVPEQYKSPTVCLTAVKQNGLALQYVPVHHKVKDDKYQICLHAIIQNPKAIYFIDEHDRNIDMCKCAVYRDVSLYDCCRVDGEMKHMTIHMMYHILSKVKEQLKFITLINELALRIDKHSLRMLVVFAVSIEPRVIEFIDEKHLNEIACDIAVRYNGVLLKYVPISVQQEFTTIVYNAINNNPMALEFVKIEKTSFMCQIAFININADHIYLRLPPLYTISQLRYNLAMNLQNVPITLRTPEICLSAYKLHRNALQFIPTDIRKIMARILQS
jgi:hypothetical protein